MKSKLYSLSILILLFSCKKDDTESTNLTLDTEIPVLSLTAPVQNINQYSGSDLLIQSVCLDNISLKTFNYTLSDNIGNSYPLSINGSYNISGISTSLSENISLPDNLFIGEYTLSCTCTDEVGNISKPIGRTFNIVDTIKPKISIVNGAEISKGATLSIEMSPTTDGRSQTIFLYSGTTLLATLTENNDIQSLNLFITSYGTGLNSKEIIFDGNQVSETFIIPDASDSRYDGMGGSIEITVKDISNNIGKSHYLKPESYINIPQ